MTLPECLVSFTAVAPDILAVPINIQSLHKLARLLAAVAHRLIIRYVRQEEQKNPVSLL